MFKGSAMKLRFRPDNGMQVIAMGRITVYPRAGAYQLYCTGMVLDGIGDLYAAFEQLKIKLAAQGLFDPVHKKALPKYPATIGIVTSSAGAAVHDMIRILRKRYPLTKVLLLSVRVQGQEAPGEIAAAIRYANHFRLADLLIVGRGGGSIEDLWAFNDEKVALAIYHSSIPVISAVGHEPDVTISDFVADLRAATPSNAAELAVPDQDMLRQTLDAMSEAMASAMNRQIKAARQHLRVLSDSPALKSPKSYLLQRKNSVESLKNRLVSAQKHQINVHAKRFVAITAKLDAMSPLKVLSRGYAMVQQEDGKIIRKIEDVAAGDCIRVTLEDGYFNATVQNLKEYEA
jgi:exodeoxyribonuclease VII large subunit